VDGEDFAWNKDVYGLVLRQLNKELIFMIKGNSPCLHVFNIRDDTLNGFLFTAE
jgi:hypothetical protein